MCRKSAHSSRQNGDGVYSLPSPSPSRLPVPRPHNAGDPSASPLNEDDDDLQPNEVVLPSVTVDLSRVDTGIFTHISSFVGESRDLLSLALTCKSFGWRPPSPTRSWSTIEEVARQAVCSRATDDEIGCLPQYDSGTTTWLSVLNSFEHLRLFDVERSSSTLSVGDADNQGMQSSPGKSLQQLVDQYSDQNLRLLRSLQKQRQKLLRWEQYHTRQQRVIDNLRRTQSVEVRVDNRRVCSGVTAKDISNARLQPASEDSDGLQEAREDALMGFHKLVGNAVRQQASWRGQHQNRGLWMPGWTMNGCLGFLVTSSSSQPAWQCIEVRGQVGFRRHGKCQHVVEQYETCCPSCKADRPSLVKMCKNEMKRRNEVEDRDLARGRQDRMYQSPSMHLRVQRFQRREIERLEKKQRRLEAAVIRMRAAAARVPNLDSEALLGDEAEFKRQYEEMMKGEKDVSRQEVFKLLFAEMALVRKRKDTHGANHGWVWSNLMVQFCGYVRYGNGGSGGMSAEAWDFLAGVCNFPKDRTLMRYNRTDTSSPDGGCFETILQFAEHLQDKPLDHPIRYGKVSIDSHTIKEGFAHDPNTNAIVGAAFDAFDPDVIVDEFRKYEEEAIESDPDLGDEDEAGDRDDAVGRTNESDQRKDDETLAKGRHYHAMVFQSWSGKHRSIHFVAGRWVLAKHSSRWLRRTTRQIIALLASFHLYVTGEAYDGASENRTWQNRTLDIKLRELIPDLIESPGDASEAMEVSDVDVETMAQPHLDEDASEAVEGSRGDGETVVAPPLDPTRRKFGADELPLDMHVASKHPSIDDLFVIALADFSHAIKKITNAVERGNLRQGEQLLPITMEMMRDVYVAGTDINGPEGAIMLFPSLCMEIFQKTAKNRMRVSFAVKLHSASMHKCILQYRDRISDRIPPEHFEAVLTHIEKTNRWTDVMNNSRNKGCEKISAVDHQHVFELLDYASYFEQWKRSMHTSDFVPSSTYEDVMRTCFGVVLTARMLLPRWEKAGYKDETIVQRNHGTDDCENLFRKSRGANSNANAKDTGHIIAGVVGGAMNSLGGGKRKNCGAREYVSNKELDSGKIKRRKIGD